MSILIKGMEMPFAGSIKTIVIYPDGTVRTRRQDPLPYTAIPVPPHGRLIDADKIEYVQSENGCLDDYAYRYDINEMPTIIPASFENPTKNARYSQDNPAEEGET